MPALQPPGVPAAAPAGPRPGLQLPRFSHNHRFGGFCSCASSVIRHPGADPLCASPWEEEKRQHLGTCSQGCSARVQSCCPSKPSERWPWVSCGAFTHHFLLSQTPAAELCCRNCSPSSDEPVGFSNSPWLHETCWVLLGGQFAAGDVPVGCCTRVPWWSERVLAPVLVGVQERSDLGLGVGSVPLSTPCSSASTAEKRLQFGEKEKRGVIFPL